MQKGKHIVAHLEVGDLIYRYGWDYDKACPSKTKEFAIVIESLGRKYNLNQYKCFILGSQNNDIDFGLIESFVLYPYSPQDIEESVLNGCWIKVSQ
jgi:hypothetical protein